MTAIPLAVPIVTPPMADWAGTGWRDIHTAPAAEIIAILAGRP